MSDCKIEHGGESVQDLRCSSTHAKQTLWLCLTQAAHLFSSTLPRSVSTNACFCCAVAGSTIFFLQTSSVVRSRSARRCCLSNCRRNDCRADSNEASTVHLPLGPPIVGPPIVGQSDECWGGGSSSSRKEQLGAEDGVHCRSGFVADFFFFIFPTDDAALLCSSRCCQRQNSDYSSSCSCCAAAAATAATCW